MKRLVVQPRLFGAVNGYEWDAEGVIQPHHDYCQLYSSEYSVRIWDPGRMTLSTPGIYGPSLPGDLDSPYSAPQIPVAAHIRGIKGEARIRFDGSVEGLGVWLDPDLGTLLDFQPSWIATMDALAGMPGGNSSVDEEPYLARDNALAAHIPVFCAMYRGTYKQIDAAAGWEIDSGPGDDPDTLLALDITSPSVIESGRLDWWDIDWVSLPRAADFTPVVGALNYPDRPDKGSFHKYALNLESNKRVSADQVLWLHWKTGCIRLPVRYRVTATGPEVVRCAIYANPKFSISVHATMLVDTKVAY